MPDENLLRLTLIERFGPVIARFNELLQDARNQGIDVAIEIAQSADCMIINANVLGTDTFAGKILFESRARSV